MLRVWLDTATLIREMSGGTKSLDHFAKAFFGMREGELFRTVCIDCRGGLRYPTLERLPGVEDRLGAILGKR